MVHRFRERGYRVIGICCGDQKFKPEKNPFLKQSALKGVPYSEILWYQTPEDLKNKIDSVKPHAVFTMEGVPFYYEEEIFKNRNFKSYSIVFNTDNLHSRIIHTLVDKTICPSEKYARLMGWKKGTYLPFGTPKYDSLGEFNASKIKEKYKIDNDFIVIFAPNRIEEWINFYTRLGWSPSSWSKWIWKLCKSRPLVHDQVLDQVINQITDSGLEFVMKGREPKAHNPAWSKYGKRYLLEESYFPGTNLELIFASKGVIAFDSTVVEEALMVKKPLVNFNVKSYRKSSAITHWKLMEEMWNSEFVLDIPLLNAGSGQQVPSFMTHFDKSIGWKENQEKYFYPWADTSSKIIDWLEAQRT